MTDGKRKPKPWWRGDLLMLALGVVSIVLVYRFEDPALNDAQRQFIVIADLVLVTYFVADWVAGMMEVRNRRRYAARNWWRLLGMVPVVIANLGFLRLLRLVRVVKVVQEIPFVRRAVRRMMRGMDFEMIRPLAMASATITLVGAGLVWIAERTTNPRLSEFEEALWWAVVTVTTVGYGDITPITRIGRAVAVLLMVTGIGTIGLLASQVSRGLVREKGARSEDLADQLSRLAELHDDGHLEDAEYEAAKQKLLGA